MNISSTSLSCDDSNQHKLIPGTLFFSRCDCGCRGCGGGDCVCECLRRIVVVISVAELLFLCFAFLVIVYACDFLRC